MRIVEAGWERERERNGGDWGRMYVCGERA
jgi:hypothetical protein